jgi:hypothetical protein
MVKAIITIFFLSFSVTSYCQQIDFDKISFNGLGFSLTKDIIVKSFGSPKIIATDYKCGFFANDQDAGPYYQLAYSNFNYIGSDKEKFILQSVDFDSKGKLVVKYGESELNGLLTQYEFIKIFGDSARIHFEKYPNNDSIILYSGKSDDGVRFIFKDGKLLKFEYWAPC